MRREIQDPLEARFALYLTRCRCNGSVMLTAKILLRLGRLSGQKQVNLIIDAFGKMALPFKG